MKTRDEQFIEQYGLTKEQAKNLYKNVFFYAEGAAYQAIKDANSKEQESKLQTSCKR